MTSQQPHTQEEENASQNWPRPVKFDKARTQTHKQEEQENSIIR